ncbi:hypothetical protein [Nocardia sp. 348MFTsu5.1]|uniref:hypothetical protein n=1 Tax=Nocardia sp. 348MFTsu5.1 TaxID=1172185 RepID=UPI00048CEEB8|nr:hypothetical protein [Nocardia sp. 348MFTsu5.1]
MRRGLLVVVLIGVWLLAGAVPATAAGPTWSGDYSLKRFAATKWGSSLAATQWEPDFADTYRFVVSCGGPCTATVVDGPTPANPTLPQPPRYTWDGTRWVHEYDWQWDCWQGEGVPKVWAPAHSVAYYTPQIDGTLTGVWRTDIDSGPCQGTVFMNVAAYPVGPPPGTFGSS